jgi:hypothetical protein
VMVVCPEGVPIGRGGIAARVDGGPAPESKRFGPDTWPVFVDCDGLLPVSVLRAQVSAYRSWLPSAHACGAASASRPVCSSIYRLAAQPALAAMDIESDIPAIASAMPPGNAQGAPGPLATMTLI